MLTFEGYQHQGAQAITDKLVVRACGAAAGCSERRSSQRAAH